MARQSSKELVREYIASGQSTPIPQLLPLELRVMVSAACHARGLTTGTARFPTGATLPYHVHDCGEAITIVEGQAEVAVEGRRYSLRQLDCIHVPEGVAHAITNASQRPF